MNKYKRAFLVLSLWAFFVPEAVSQSTPTVIGHSVKELHEIYKWLHQNPELSFQEQKTSTLLADEMTALGFDVAQGVGDEWVQSELARILGHSTDGLSGYGVVAVLRNGPGPVVMIRTDMDALPVIEETGLPYASRATTVNSSGQETGIMHACGHDVHMTAWIGTARRLSQQRDDWSGTLLMVAQPAEELGLGAISMIEDKVLKSSVAPNYILAFHVSAGLEAGKIGHIFGPAMASISAVDIKVKGVGGHGAYPHTTKDPVVIAAHIVTSLQTLVSREVDPRQPAVVTVGALNSGSKRNIISNEATLLLTVRTYDDTTREKLLDGIVRIAQGQARSFGAPQPEVYVTPIIGPPVINEPDLTSRAVAVISDVLGSETLQPVEAVMAGEDFGRFGRQLGDNIPSLLLWLGVVDPELMSAVERDPTQELPSLHSPKFAPDPGAIETGVIAMTAIANDLFNRPL